MANPDIYVEEFAEQYSYSNLFGEPVSLDEGEDLEDYNVEETRRYWKKISRQIEDPDYGLLLDRLSRLIIPPPLKNGIFEPDRIAKLYSLGVEYRNTMIDIKNRLLKISASRKRCYSELEGTYIVESSAKNEAARRAEAKGRVAREAIQTDNAEVALEAVTEMIKNLEQAVMNTKRVAETYMFFYSKNMAESGVGTGYDFGNEISQQPESLLDDSLWAPRKQKADEDFEL